MTKVGKEHGIYQGIPTRKQPNRQTKKTACEKMRCQVMADSKYGKNSKAVKSPKFCRKQKKCKKLPKVVQFDFIEILIIEKGMTGENLTLKIFSYLDFSSLTEARQVSKTWNQFLTKQKCIWMAKLRRTQPFLERICKSLGMWKNILESLEKRGKIEDIIDTFMRIQCLIGNPESEIGEKFEDDYVNHVKKVIRQTDAVFGHSVENPKNFEKKQQEQRMIFGLSNTAENFLCNVKVKSMFWVSVNERTEHCTRDRLFR